MGLPQSTNRLISAPVQALRAVFTGIGRIVMAADQPKTVEPQAQPADPTSRWRSLDATGNVRLLSAEDLDDDYERPAQPTQAQPTQAQGEPAPAPPGRVEDEPALAQPAPESEPEAEAEVAPDGDVLPLAGYDNLSLPSIRARLRSLDADELRVLVSYERTHAERPDVLGMLERRIEKLETGL
jgi:hypothetical protein